MVDDKRTRHTKERIEQAMISCLADTSLDKITVVQICKVAGINRGTFYAHYPDPMALYKHMEQKMTKFLEKIFRDIKNNNISYMDAFVIILENAQKNKAAFLALYNSNSQSIKQALIDGWLDKLVLAPPELKKDNAYAAEFYVNGILSMTARWVREDCPKSIDSMAKLIYRLTVRE